MFKRARREHPEVVDVAGFVALIAGANFLGDDLGQGEANDVRRGEWQVLEVALFELGASFRRQRRRFAAADLELDFAAAGIPVMDVSGIDAPRKPVLGFVVALVKD